MFLTHFRVFFHQFPTILCTFAQTFSTHCTKIALAKRAAFWHVCTNFFQLAAALFPACEKLCNNLFPAISQLPAAFSYATTAFSFHFVSVSTAFPIRNVSISTTFLARIVYTTTMFLTHIIYLSITKYL